LTDKIATTKMLALILLSTLTFCGKALAADRSYADQGIELYNQRNYRGAAQLLGLAVETERDNAAAFYYMGNCTYALGQRDTAVKYYWYVIHHFSSTKEAYYSRDVLRRIDPDYSKNSAISFATRARRTGAKPLTIGLATGSGSKQELIDGLMQVLKSQGNRPNVSERLIASAKAALSHYPTPLLALLVQRGIKICLTPTTIDQDPRSQNTKPRGYEEGTTYKNCPGFFNGRMIVVCEYALRGADDSAWSNTSDPIGTLRHEMGHAIDSCLGGLSGSEEFKHAYYLDVGRIDEDAKPRIAYYLQTAQGGPSETFAELICYDFGGRTRDQARCQLVHLCFKQASGLIDQKLAQVCQK
jgi:hypothetical protein